MNWSKKRLQHLLRAKSVWSSKIELTAVMRGENFESIVFN